MILHTRPIQLLSESRERVRGGTFFVDPRVVHKKKLNLDLGFNHFRGPSWTGLKSTQRRLLVTEFHFRCFSAKIASQDHRLNL